MQVVQKIENIKGKVKVILILVFVYLRPFYQLGSNSLAVPVSLHANNRRRICERLTNNEAVPKGAIILLQGGEQRQRYCTDVDVVFRQV